MKKLFTPAILLLPILILGIVSVNNTQSSKSIKASKAIVSPPAPVVKIIPGDNSATPAPTATAGTFSAKQGQAPTFTPDSAPADQPQPAQTPQPPTVDPQPPVPTTPPPPVFIVTPGN